jgi:hypothetical protein
VDAIDHSARISIRKLQTVTGYSPGSDQSYGGCRCANPPDVLASIHNRVKASLLTELRKPSRCQQDMSRVQFLFELFKVRFDQRPQFR